MLSLPLKKGEKYRSFTIDFQMVTKFNIYLADELEENPDCVLAHAEEALELMKQQPALLGVRARLTNYNRTKRVRDLRAEDVNHLIFVEGTTRKVTDVNPRIVDAAFECARCKNQIYIPQEGGGKFIEPSFCTCNEEKKGVFRLLYNESHFENYQRITVQESPDELKGGEQPQTMPVNLTDDLVGEATAGIHVKVVGVLRSHQVINRDGKTCFFDLYMDGCGVEYMDETYEDVEVTQEDIEQIKKLADCPPEELRKKFIGSIAPSIYGYDEVKETIAYQLVGGVVKTLPDGTRIRGDIHSLLVGDPGIAKSQILRYVVRLAPRGIYASGKGATGAGLTAAATKDEFDGQWTLEAGALVLADKGVACIDEMDKMKSEDRSSLHEGMESQTISVAKAGILATLKCRCAILAAANPKLGRFDPYENLPEQINMPPSLLSRFDLIYILRDTPNVDRDKHVSNHITSTHVAGEKLEHCRYMKGNSNVDGREATEAMNKVCPVIDPKLVRKYVAYAKSHVFPIMTPKAVERAIDFYMKLRKSTESGAVAITARQLEGITRLAEASARLRLSQEASVEDVENAIRLIQHSLREVSTDKETGKLDIDVLNVGVSHAQRERIIGIKQIIGDLMKASPDGLANMDDIVTKAAEHNISKEKIEKEMSKLRTIGDVINSSGNRWKLT